MKHCEYLDCYLQHMHPHYHLSKDTVCFNKDNPLLSGPIIKMPSVGEMFLKEAIYKKVLKSKGVDTDDLMAEVDAQYQETISTMLSAPVDTGE